MRNPIRRSRNIGTAKQGYGRQNKLVIPTPYTVSQSFYERLEAYEKVTRVINGHTFVFVIEGTIPPSKHACSIEDIERMISYIPASDYGALKLIVLRQPRKKEAIISPVWGRLIYSYEFERNYYPAVILEAADYSRKLKWPRKLCLEDQQELERLKEDGHLFTADTRSFTAILEPENVRNTQLYRTLLHEFGHYVHYLRMVETGEADDAAQRENAYGRLPKETKEKFAHQYADTLAKMLRDKKLIPFAPVPDDNPTP